MNHTGSFLSLNAPSGAQCFPTYWALDLTGPFAKKSQCTFWCSVLSDGPYTRGFGFEFYQESQCTFWCSVLSDGLTDGWTALPVVIRLNAPSGAQCFPTARMGQRIRAHHVSMHLLVLSAFRLIDEVGEWLLHWSLNAPSGAQCFPT